MSMFTPAERDWTPEPMTPVEVTYYRDVLVTHADDLVLAVCQVCQVTRCPDWRTAYDRLALAGQLMATPDRWQGAAEVKRKPRP